MRPWVWLGGGTVAVATVAVVTICFSPSGTGEHRVSPDGRFNASAMNMTRRTVLAGPIRYIELTVEEADSGREVWRTEYRYPVGMSPPDYGDRSQTSITWAADSSEVRFPIGSGRILTVPLP